MTQMFELSEEARIAQAADQARRVLNGEESGAGSAGRLAQVLRQAASEAPLHALAIAFLLGVIVARRR